MLYIDFYFSHTFEVTSYAHVQKIIFWALHSYHTLCTVFFFFFEILYNIIYIIYSFILNFLFFFWCIIIDINIAYTIVYRFFFFLLLLLLLLLFFFL